MGWTRRTGLVVGLVVLLGGCWPAPGVGPGRAAYNAIEHGFDAENVGDFTELWTATTDETGERGVSHPIVSDGAVFVGSTHSVYAFDEATGALRWTKTPDPATYDGVDTELFFDHGAVYVSLRRGELNWEPAQFDAADGSWFTAEMNGLLEAVRGNGSGLPTVLLSQFTATPASPRTRSGFVFPGGGPTWLTDRPTNSRLTLGTDRYFHAGQGLGPGGLGPYEGVQAVATTGNPTGPLWRAPIEAMYVFTPALSADGRTVFVATQAPSNSSEVRGHVVALDTATGAVRWSVPTGLDPTAPPALADDVLYVPITYGLLALSARDGSLLWAVPLNKDADDAADVQPAVAGGVVFVGTRSGKVVAFDADGCGQPSCAQADPIWSASTGSRITGAPAVSNGRLFVGTQDGRVVAYGLPPS
jgi:outer membrane protein assembly factor BamB